MLISNELLSKVLNPSENIKIESSIQNPMKDNELIINYVIDNVIGVKTIEVNIYELAHKCKEWALNKEYIIEVGVHPTIKKDHTNRNYFYTVKTDRGGIFIPEFVEIIKSETECIFKACEWILAQLKQSKGTKCGS